MAESQDIYVYSAESLNALSDSFSEKRLKTYLHRVGQVREDAIGLQLWNSRLSKALRFPLETTEIVIRNRIHSALTDRWGADWSKSAGFLAQAALKTKQKIADATTATLPNYSPDRMVAALSFGFWPAMFNEGFVAEVWQSRIDKTFPNLPSTLDFDEKISLIKQLLATAHLLRNRISHLEPIFTRNLSKEHADLVRLVSFACKPTAYWMRHHSTFASVMRDGPSGIVRETIPFRSATKSFTQCSSDKTLNEALKLLNDTGSDFVVITLDQDIRVLSASEIGRWLTTKTADGIVDLTATSLKDVLEVTAAPPLVARKESISTYLSELSKTKSRYIVINEDGKPGQKPLAILDALALMVR